MEAIFLRAIMTISDNREWLLPLVVLVCWLMVGIQIVDLFRDIDSEMEEESQLSVVGGPWQKKQRTSRMDFNADV